MKNGKQNFVVFQSEMNQETFRLDHIDRISVDTTRNAEGFIRSVDIYINDEHWESFDGEDLEITYWRKLHPEVLKAITTKLNGGESYIDMDVLVSECIARVRGGKQ